MSFTIPNVLDALNADQAEVDSVDVDILVAGYARTGVLSGCAVTAQSPVALTVDIAAGVVIVAGVRASVTATTTTHSAPGSDPRFDLVVSDSSGTISAVEGLSNANPVFPAVPASSVALAAIYFPGSATTIASNQVTDKRVIVGTHGDNIKLELGDDADSVIYYDGIDTFWDLQAVGSGGLMIAGAASFPSPDAGVGSAVHIWHGSAGSVAAPNNAALILEHSGGMTLQFLVPNTSDAGIRVGSPTDGNNRAQITYSGNLDLWRFRIDQGNRLSYSAGTFAFQEATEILTTAGVLKLNPATYIDANGNNFNNVNAISGKINDVLEIHANLFATDVNAQRLVLQTLDATGNAFIVAAYADPTGTETTPFWAQRVDITTPLVGTLDASFGTIQWVPGDDTVVFYVNDAGTIRSINLGTVNLAGDMILSPTNDIVIGAGVFIEHSTTEGITASTTQTQAGGTVLTSEVNEVSTVANNNDAVTMPDAAAGRKVTIINNGANTLLMFPKLGDDLGAGVDASEELELNEVIDFVAYDDTNWHVESTTGNPHALMSDTDNTDEYVINAQTDAHMYHTNGMVASDLGEWTFDAGGAGTSHAIASIADGAASGVDIAVTTGTNHLLAVGDIISQTNLASAVYTGTFIVKAIISDTIYEVAAVFSATDTGTMDQAAVLICGADAAGQYGVWFGASGSIIGNNETFDFAIHVGATHQDTTNARRKFGTAGDVGNYGVPSLIRVGAGEKVSFMVSNVDSAANIIIRDLTVVLIRQ